MANSATVGILRVLLSANSAEFETAMGRAEKSLGGVGKQGAAMSAVMTGVVAGGVAAVATAALNLATMLGTKLVSSIGEVITRGGEVAGIAGSFERLSGGAGQAERTIGTLRDATRGLVSTFDLMQSSNKAILLGLGLSEQEMGDLAKTATVLGRAMGMDATKSLDDLITALGRSSPMILDNLGLTVKLGEANEAYAAKLGKTSSDLTDAEKKQAFMAAAMAAARTKVAELGEAQLTLTERLQQASTWYQNVFDRVSRGIAESPKLAAAFDGIARSLAIAFGGDSQGLVTTIIGLVEGLASSVLTTAQAALGAADGIVRAWHYVQGVFYGSMDAILSVESGLRGLAASAFEMAAKTPGVGRAFDGVATSMRAAATETTALRDQYRQSASDANAAAAGQSAFSQTIQQVQFALTDAQAAMTAAKTATRETGAAATQAKPPIDALGASLAGAGGKARGAADDLKIVTGELDNITRFQIAGILHDDLVEFETDTDNARLAMEEVTDAMFRLQGAATTIAGPLTSNLKLPWVEAKAAVAEAKPEVDGFFTKVFGSASEFGGSVSSIFQAAFVGGGGALGAVKSFATQAMSNLLAMIPGIGGFVSAFAGPIIEMFSKLIGKAREFFGELFGGPSRGERNDRGSVAAFVDEIAAGSAAAAGETEEWRRANLALEEAYLAVGRSAEEAHRDAERLLASSREGGEETWRVIDEIRRKMEGAGDAAVEAVEDVTGAISRVPRQVDIEFRTRRTGDDGGEGYATGTLGRHGAWFHRFALSGTPTALHGVEAVLRPQDALPFAFGVFDSLARTASPNELAAAQPSNTSTTNVVMIAIPQDAAGDPYRIANEVFRQWPDATASDRHGMRTAIERVIEDYQRTYG